MKLIAVLLAASIAFIGSPAITNDKNPMLTAGFILAILGLGQIYNGEALKGSCIITGFVLTSVLSCGLAERNDDPERYTLNFDESEDDKALYFLGGLAWAGLSILGK